MQFIETSSFGVRSAIYRLGKSGNCVSFVLFPMIHVGSPDYYAAIKEKLSECDCVLTEGVASKHALVLTLSYRLAASVRGRGLVTQHSLDLRPFEDKIVHSDVEGNEFDHAWTQIPWRDRLRLYAVIPFVALYMLLFGTKRVIARFAEANDLPSREEIFMSDEKWDDLIVNQRDERLVHRITELEARYRADGKIVGVVFGASHMRAVTALLMEKLSYHVTRSEWITVFEY